MSFIIHILFIGCHSSFSLSNSNHIFILVEVNLFPFVDLLKPELSYLLYLSYSFLPQNNKTLQKVSGHFISTKQLDEERTSASLPQT